MESSGPGFDLLLSDGNTLDHNVSQRNADGGFHLATSASNMLTYNVANGNGSVGFDVYFDSGSNTMSKNAAHGNAVFDARDAGLGNIWTKNNFGTTSGI